MESFVPTQQPDEGYSEDPLNQSSKVGLGAAVAASDLRSYSALPAWLSRQISALPVSSKTQLALYILNELPTNMIVDIVEQLKPRLFIDFVRYLPPEVCLKILGYLDPLSLISTARSCRTWYELALDRKLWERLYYLEGWKAFPHDIRVWEEKVNHGINGSVSSFHRVQSSDGGHTKKKRALSPATDLDGDRDFEMVDADRPLMEEPRDEEMTESASLFGGRSFARTTMTPSLGRLDIQGSGSSSKKADPKGKGKAPSYAGSEQIKTESLPEIVPSQVPVTLPKSTLWLWDAPAGRYRINWKYLYSMRRRLETNWEFGKFTNFQLPHPLHPEEGHQECIYSLQFNSEYLVSGSRDRTIRIWNLQTRRLARPPLTGHAGSVLCLQFDSTPEEDLIVTGSSDSHVILWRFSTGEILQRLRNAHRESVLNVKFDKRILVTCSKDKTIKVFNRQPLKAGDMGYGEVPFNPVPVRLRSYETELSLSNELPIKAPYTMIAVLEGHAAAVNAVQIYNDEIVSASGDRHIKVWKWPESKCERTIMGHTKGIACVQYDGRRIVSGSSDNEVKVFDRVTGAEVASLRNHSMLVRTVQSGFGDLPYSLEEDLAKAREVDVEYFRAIASGELMGTPQRGLPRNAGSSRPQDISAYGAKLPPGGGGGPHARIVSGSYDQTIIIWRRDKEGNWKANHVLKQEEAAAAAAQTGRPSGSHPILHPAGSLRPPVPPPPPPAATSSVPSAGATASASASSAPARGSGSRSAPPAARPTQPSPLEPCPTLDSLQQQSSATPQLTTVDYPILATLTPQATLSYSSMIDQLVPQGAQVLSQALSKYPTMLALHNHLQRAIDREPSPFLRSQLRQAVSTAMVRTQIQQHRARQVALQNAANGSYGSEAIASAGSSSSTAAPSGSQPQPSHAQLAAATPAPANPMSISSVVATGPTQTPIPAAAPAQQQTPAPAAQAAPPQQTLQQQQQQQGSATPAATQQQPAQAPPHHPHIAGDNTMRVFKLQFDARRILCCSQSSVIVGWDFCNGDSELEEATRFFAPIE